MKYLRKRPFRVCLKLAILKIEKGKKSRIRNYTLVLFQPFRFFGGGCLGHTAEKGMT